ncbi:quinone reductase [Xylogone sp. PMI_703]|nr:quinone reductase [Xylogone sp. PMI_703]
MINYEYYQRIAITILQSHSVLKNNPEMQSIRVHRTQSSSGEPYSAANPAPSSALRLETIPIPKPQKPGEILVRVKAATVTRDELTWPETYHQDITILGHDFSGTVVSVVPDESSPVKFQVGDEVYGMTAADRPLAWAEYVLVSPEEVALKPKDLTWEEAAALPLTALTAYQALFVRAKLPFSQKAEISRDRSTSRILITGATGGVGIYLVQLAKFAGYSVTATTSSKARNEEFLKELGAHETLEYGELDRGGSKYDIVIDTVGGQVLEKCWSYVNSGGSLITVDSASFDFVRKHKEEGKARQDAKAEFFIVEPSSEELAQISECVSRGAVKVFVAGSFPLSQAKEAYDSVHDRSVRRGKVVLVVSRED